MVGVDNEAAEASRCAEVLRTSLPYARAHALVSRNVGTMCYKNTIYTHNLQSLVIIWNSHCLQAEDFLKLQLRHGASEVFHPISLPEA